MLKFGVVVYCLFLLRSHTLRHCSWCWIECAVGFKKQRRTLANVDGGYSIGVAVIWHIYVELCDFCVEIISSCQFSLLLYLIRAYVCTT
jgi:hypothetical protein